MTDKEFLKKHKEISDDYYKHRIDRSEYIKRLGELNRARTPRKPNYRGKKK